MTSKEFAGCIRPALDAHGVIAHGHLAAMVLSYNFVAKDSSWCCDLLAWTLNVIGGYTDLRSVHANVQCDNTTRECKNGTILRFLALQVGGQRLKSGQLSCLMSGHSHEDVDMWFASIAHVLESRNELHTPRTVQSRFGPPPPRSFSETARTLEVREACEQRSGLDLHHLL